MATKRTLVETISDTEAMRRRRIAPTATRAQRERLVQKDPREVQKRYRSGLATYSRRIDAAIARRMPKMLSTDPAERDGALSRLEDDIDRIFGRGDRLAATVFKNVAKQSRRAAARTLRLDTAAENIGSLAIQEHDFVIRQTNLLGAIGRDQVTAIREAVLLGKAPEDIQALSYISRNRMALMAKMEPHYLAEAEIKRIAILSGSEGGVYHTMHDERVRPTHAALDGQFFRYDALPDQLTEPGCRCRILPVGALS